MLGAESTWYHPRGEIFWRREWASLTQSHFEELPLASRAGRCAKLDEHNARGAREGQAGRVGARKGQAGRVGAPNREQGEPRGVAWA